MAGADSSIYSMIRPYQQGPGPLDQYAQGMQLKALMGQGELHDIKKRGLLRDEQTGQQLRDLFGRNPNPTDAEVMGVDPVNAGPVYLKNRREAAKSEAEQKRIEAETLTKNIANLRNIAARVQDDGSLAVLRENAFKLFGPKAVEGMPQSVADPRFKDWQVREIADADKLLERLSPKADIRDTGGSVQGFNPYTMEPIGGATAKTATPGDLLTDTRTRSEGAANRGVTVRGQNLTDARAREATAATAGAGRIPPGYRQTADGNLEAIPGGPADKVNTKSVETQRTLDAYVAARDGLMTSLAGTVTGPVAGRVAPLTTGQQVAEGGVAAMAPVLKQLFRVAGEGVFTDRDQQLLMDMVPKRTDNAAAAAEKMANIDRIVAAKLGVPVPQGQTANGKIGGGPSRDQIDAELRRRGVIK